MAADRVHAVFGANANQARADIDAALADWQNLIANFNYSPDSTPPNTFTVDISIGGTGFGASTSYGGSWQINELMHLDFQVIDATLPVLDAGLHQLLTQLQLLSLELADLGFQLWNAILGHLYHHFCRDTTSIRPGDGRRQSPRSEIRWPGGKDSTPWP